VRDLAGHVDLAVELGLHRTGFEEVDLRHDRTELGDHAEDRRDHLAGLGFRDHRHDHATRAGYAATHAGLALAVSVAALVNAGLLYRGLRQDGIMRHSSGWPALLFRFLAANAAMTVLLVTMAEPVDWWLAKPAAVRASWLAVQVVAGAAAYFGTLLLLGVRTHTLRLDID